MSVGSDVYLAQSEAPLPEVVNDSSRGVRSFFELGLEYFAASGFQLDPFSLFDRG